jgi:integrase
MVSAPVGATLRLMLITGQRVQQVLYAKWEEFDLDNKQWLIPTSRTKGHDNAHMVPLTLLAIEILEGLKSKSADNDFLFPQRVKQSKPIEANSLSKSVRNFCDQKDVERFVARDLRRTTKTLMGKCGVSKETRDRIQNHALTDVSSKHYDKYDYWTEKKAGLEKWDLFLHEIISGKPSNSNVISMNTRQHTPR